MGDPEPDRDGQPVKVLAAVALMVGGWVGWNLQWWSRKLLDWFAEDDARRNKKRDEETAQAVLDAMEDLWGPASIFTPPWTKPKAKSYLQATNIRMETKPKESDDDGDQDGAD